MFKCEVCWEVEEEASCVFFGEAIANEVEKRRIMNVMCREMVIARMRVRPKRDEAGALRTT